MDFVLDGYVRTDLQSALQSRISETKTFAPPDIGGELQTVNNYYNTAITYQSDFPHDVWAEPGETQARGYGDCEDLAIIKAAHLLRTGEFNWQTMAIFVGTFRYPSTSGEPPQSHAMLVVRAGDELLGLDNNYVVVRPFAWWLTDTHPTEPQVFSPTYAVTPYQTSLYVKVGG